MAAEAADKLGIPDRRSAQSSPAPEPAAAEPELAPAPPPAPAPGPAARWATPWAGTDTNGAGDGRTAPSLPETVFSPPLAEGHAAALG
ncbi:hypothetical protein [Streptomyces sp. KL116D]|uniref:hypothetical protein n=1 Tax=Streptomyces sp. KL116D TaxID=3045152 RepID=UPI0035585BC6